ncbi:MAG: ABC transporter permease [Pseudolabrys sp.]
MRVTNIFNLGVKELRSLIRDPVMLALIVFALSFAVYTAATALPETLHKASINPPTLITRAQMDERMDKGLTTFALDIPPNFQRDVLAGRKPDIQLNVDATRITQAFTGAGYIQNIIATEVAAFVRRYRSEIVLPVDLALRVRFNPSLNKSWFGAVVEVINQVTLLSIILTGAALIREREHGTIEHLLVMPVTPLEIMVGKVWSMALVVLVGCALSLTLVVQGLLSVPIEGSIALFLAAAAVELFAATSLGIFLATMARSMPQFALLTILVYMPLEMLSGGMTPRESMPQIVQDVMLVAPTTHFVSLAQAVLFRGAGFSVVWPQFLALVAIGTVLFALAALRFRKAIGEMA